jgi:hypothetical protein
MKIQAQAGEETSIGPYQTIPPQTTPIIFITIQAQKITALPVINTYIQSIQRRT